MGLLDGTAFGIIADKTKTFYNNNKDQIHALHLAAAEEYKRRLEEEERYKNMSFGQKLKYEFTKNLPRREDGSIIWYPPAPKPSPKEEDKEPASWQIKIGGEWVDVFNKGGEVNNTMNYLDYLNNNTVIKGESGIPGGAPQPLPQPVQTQQQPVNSNVKLLGNYLNGFSSGKGQTAMTAWGQLSPELKALVGQAYQQDPERVNKILAGTGYRAGMENGNFNFSKI